MFRFFRPMTGCRFDFNGAAVEALANGALWWQEHALLCVADLHLGKAERIVRQGGSLLPPYGTRETLNRLSLLVEALRPEVVICLGDSFDDVQAERGLARADYISLATMMAGRHWVWIAGNHDPGPVEMGGAHLAELSLSPLTFRHIARPGATAEISGHYHPKAQIRTRAGTLSRPAFLIDADRVSDDESYLIAHEIAKRVSNEMTFPGEIRVTVLRETRAIEIAR